MPLDRNRCRPLLQNFDFRSLFIEEVGWDTYKAALDIPLKSGSARLESIAHKRGFVAWHCATPAGGKFPDSSARRKIEREVAKAAHEHLIVFTDAGKSRQIWQWVRRDPGQPLRVRELDWAKGQSGEAVLQKLDPLFVSLDDEEALTLLDVTARARGNVSERVTRRFYEEFRRQHGTFLKFITGIPNQGDHEWYASVMLNRLMFVYFVQKKGFLDGDTDYLRNRLSALKKQHKGDKFYSFYRAFLLRLFHEGLGGKKRKNEVENLIGRVPYLNGGIFDVHQLERDYGDAIQIPDKAFEAVFDYFDKYQWHLDERPLSNDNEINPDVLGYIFEKYINQKQMGAYYTKEDITEYIGKSCIIPFLFDSARSKCKVAFVNADGPTIWDLLRENPDRYIYPAVRHGCDLPLPKEIAAGLDTKKPNLIERRKPWNKPAPEEYALPTEIWRETVARRQRYEEVRAKLANGEIRDINDFITFNIDLRQFAQDVIQNCEGPDLLMSLWQVLSTMTILDPTGGSGAFLFAALDILSPLYEGCLDRMAGFLTEWGDTGKKTHPNYHKKFSEVLAHVAVHPNRRYFVLKSTILNNLYAVDIMDEAVEICKLRLFLKLAAQVDPDPDKENYGIEPLPDIDFNIRAGNTLVGYATYEEVKRAVTSAFDFDNAMETIATKAADLQQTFDTFRQLQTQGDGTVPADHKKELQKRLKALEDELNRYLAGEYGVKVSDKIAYNNWLQSHQPFHWFIQFYGIIKEGGFDVIIGNPPYVEYSQIRNNYTTPNLSMVPTGNLYSLVIERCSLLMGPRSMLGVIVPISSVSTPRMVPLMNLFNQAFDLVVISNFAVRPGKLFVGVDMNLSIFIARMNKEVRHRAIWSTNYVRWNEEARCSLFPCLSFVPSKLVLNDAHIRKVGFKIEEQLLEKVASNPRIATIETRVGGEELYYHSGGRYYRKCLKEKLSTEYKLLRIEKGYGPAVITTITSSFYYWLWLVVSDCYHVTKGDIAVIPISKTAKEDKCLKLLSEQLLKSLWKNAEKRVRNRNDGTSQVEINFKVGLSKPIIDEIDTILASHYGFTEEELDFIINYDIKYRMGRGGGEEEA
ncbi:MAG: hypothetical protein B9S37_00855 [Verrucomicrobiia bacterium Tous-C3TDCM]|nr:MAG: hypothetical protein B9S37_00855 [Verrucomicrobiae bacterium Tous-C3TDCM]PAZ07003.1 MAG: hypothetical protein CAK88_01765 [Verrucomicrobiae bacterium AMD-G2]